MRFPERELPIGGSYSAFAALGGKSGPLNHSSEI